MLSINKTYCVIFFITLLLQVPGVHSFLGYADELIVLAMLMLMALDIVINRNFARYKPIYIVALIFFVYFLFTVAFRDFNTKYAAFNDFILQQKAYLPLLVFYAVAPQFSPRLKNVMKKVCIVNAAIVLAAFASGVFEDVLVHVSNAGVVCFNSFLVYLYCSIDDDGLVSRKDLFVALAILTVGLTSTRSKFYGEYVIAYFMLFLYKPGMLKNFNIKKALLVLMLIGVVVLVAWQKIEYYYITGNAGVYDPEVIETYARPVLYITMFLILLDYPLLGSGLASFATHSSSPHVHYSDIYHQYGIDIVYGLSPEMPDFINDAFFAQFAQFGLIGILLFLYYWIWIYNKLKLGLHEGKTLEFSIGMLIVAFAMIESTSGSMIIKFGGLLPLMLLGMIISKYRTIDKETKKRILMTNPLTDKRYGQY